MLSKYSPSLYSSPTLSTRILVPECLLCDYGPCQMFDQHPPGNVSYNMQGTLTAALLELLPNLHLGSETNVQLSGFGHSGPDQLCASTQTQ